MQRLLSILVLLAWGLWFGGILMVFIAVTSVFASLEPNRVIAGSTASGIFQRFEIYQLALAAGILLAMLAWRLLSARSRLKNTILVCFALSTAIAMVETLVISTRLERMRTQHQTSSDEFKRLHGLSMALYSGEALILLVAGVLLPSAIFGDRPAATGVGIPAEVEPARRPQPATS